MEDVSTQSNELGISVPPLIESGVEYFGLTTVPIHITNLSTNPVLLEDITLRFKSDSGIADNYVDRRCDVRIPANGLGVISVDVKPTVLYQEYTNYFGILIHYRKEVNGRMGETRMNARHDQASYLIIKRPKDTVADIFISFKQPEYLSWAKLLERYALRAGFNPYIVVMDPQPGTNQWKRIEEEIQRSKAVFVIWGNRTDWGKGVQAEVQLCRNHAVEEILLLEQDLDIPTLFKDTSIEYLRFDPDNPHLMFATAVESTRQRFLKSA